MIISKKILVVENEVSTRKILVDKLRRENFTVLEAKDGFEGLTIALAEHPDLILTDIFMPKMDGMEMLNELHKDLWGKQVAVIILSNLDDDSNVVEKIKHSNYDYLLKVNYNLSTLIDKIKIKLGIV